MPGWQQRLYALAPQKAKEWLVAAEALRLNRYRRYGDYESVRHDYAFSRYQELSQEDLREWQLGRLRSIVAYAREHSAFYRDRLPERIESLDDLRLISVLRKTDVREHSASILAAGLPPRHLWPDHTSGTTGSPLHFFIGREGVRIRFATMDEYFASFGCRYGDRRVRFGVQRIVPPSRKRPPFWVYNRVDNQLHMSVYHLDKSTLPLYIQKLNQFQPAYLSGYAHVAYLLGRHLCEHGGLTFYPRAVFTDTEQLYPEYRKAIEQGFGAPCYDIYGTRELNWVAVECPHQRHHSLQLCSILEVVDAQGQPLPAGQAGRIVVTDLTQQAFPFIRYDTGDIGSLSPERCDCGWRSVVLQEIEGRSEDYVITPQGRRVLRLGSILWAGRNTIESQIAQTHPDRVVIRVVPATGFAPRDARDMLVAAHDVLGEDMRVDWEIVESIPRTSRGKFKRFVRECDIPEPW